MYFDAAVVFAIKSSLLFRLALAVFRVKKMLDLQNYLPERPRSLDVVISLKSAFLSCLGRSIRFLINCSKSV